MLESILIGIVILLAFIIFLIIFIGAIKAMKKKSKKKKMKAENKNNDIQELKTEEEEITPIEDKVNKLLDESGLDLELEAELLELDKDEKHLLEEQVQTMISSDALVISLAQGEGTYIGDEVYPCGKYELTIISGNEEVKIRTSRYVNVYQNGAIINFETKQKVTPISGGIELKKID